MLVFMCVCFVYDILCIVPNIFFCYHLYKTDYSALKKKEKVELEYDESCYHKGLNGLYNTYMNRQPCNCCFIAIRIL